MQELKQKLNKYPNEMLYQLETAIREVLNERIESQIAIVDKLLGDLK